MDEDKQVELTLLQFQHDQHQIMLKYMPDKLGSDAFKTEMLACVHKYTDAILEIFI